MYALRYAGASVLRTVARPVRPDERNSLAPLVSAMSKLMKREKAQGLCAPQLGVGVRLLMMANWSCSMS